MYFSCTSPATTAFIIGANLLTLRYEVKYEEGQECGGGYLKLLSEGAEKDIQKFTDKTPYTIMFGPDKYVIPVPCHIIAARAGRNEIVRNEITMRSLYKLTSRVFRCGMTSKVHFILRHTNPKNGTISVSHVVNVRNIDVSFQEHHAKQPSKSLASYFDDKKTHLYTLVIRPDEHFQVLVDNYEIVSGSLLKV